MWKTASAANSRLVAPVHRVIEGTVLESPARALWHTVTRKERARRDLAHAKNVRYDELTVAVMEKVLSGTSNCVDAGAHKGDLLAHMVRLSPQGRHYAFEPIPDYAGVLRETFPTVSVHECALADETTVAQFHYVRSCPAYSGLDRRVEGGYDERSVQMIDVAVTRLDDVLDPSVPVDFIKIDVEGAEARLLRGAGRTLRSWKPVIVTEVGPKPMDAYDEFRHAGFGVYRLDDWLEGRAPLTEAEFRAALWHDFYYLAST